MEEENTDWEATKIKEVEYPQQIEEEVIANEEDSPFYEEIITTSQNETPYDL